MKKLKVFTTPWHIAHQHDLYEALKDVVDVYFLINYTRRWDEKVRPFPRNMKWVTSFEKGKYDFALLHIDQQCTLPELNKAILPVHMRKAIREAEPTLPVIWINHATPVYPENYPDGNRANEFISKTLIKEILDIIGDDEMVVNSNQAAKDWSKGTPIIHGLNEKEWICDKEKEPRVATFISQAGIGDKYYNRSYLVEVMEYLIEKYAIRLQWINTPTCFNARDIKDYKEFLSKTLVYFNPTFASPMPRSRTEAMLSGCCVVTTPQHDADKFIENGVNGFLVPHNNSELTGEIIATLIRDNYKGAKEIGIAGRKTAIKLFSRKRYKDDWVKLLKKLKILK